MSKPILNPVPLSTGIVVLLVVCHTPKTLINFYESYQVQVIIDIVV